MKPPRKLLTISHCKCYYYQDQLFSYGPYVREMEVWADLFEEIKIASPYVEAEPPNDCLPFFHKNISVIPQRETGGENLPAKIKQVLLSPVLIWSLIKAMRSTDATLVRCPGNLGLLGVVFAPLFSRYRIAKYAGLNGRHGQRLECSQRHRA